MNKGLVEVYGPVRMTSSRHPIFDEKDEIIPHAMIGDATARQIRLTNKFSKADQSGFGRVLFHERQHGPEVFACIVTEMEIWFRYTHDHCQARETDPVMRCCTLPTLAKYKNSTCLKIGVSESNVSPLPSTWWCNNVGVERFPTLFNLQNGRMETGLNRPR
jgi:hypothetical protein